MGRLTVRQARIIFISILVMARLVYKDDIIYYSTTNSVSNTFSKTTTDTPISSLPEHHVPLPLNSSSLYFDAIDTNGNRGYVADPTLLRRLVLQFHRTHTNATYWDRIQQYESHLLLDKNSTNSITMDKICSLTGGNGGGKELNDDGVKIITEYVKVDIQTPILRRGCTESLPLKHERPKLFCGVYTHNPARDFTRLSALSYGWKCDGFLAFSTVTIPSLGMVGLLHKGEESYHNMVQKTRSIWSYIATNYINQFDYFHLGGDDMHVIVENMRSLLLEHEAEGIAEQGRIFGQLVSKGTAARFIRGGAGYTLDRAGLQKLHDYMPGCATEVLGYWEDNAVTLCARKIGLLFSDNRDSCTGQQRSHTVSPGILSNAQGRSESALDQYLRSWALLPHPSQKAVQVGLQLGFEAASNHSVTFHELRYPSWMVRHHALLYRACPVHTALGTMYSDGNQKNDLITYRGA